MINMDFEIYALIENKLGCMLSNMDTTLEDDGTVLLTLDGQDFDVGSDFNKIVAFLEKTNKKNRPSEIGGFFYNKL